jgi:redox-sensitive bicupin YhaK (pirin superfamily)
VTSPIRHPSDPLLVDLELAAGARVALPANAPERGVFVIEGAVELGAEPLAANHLGVLAAGSHVELRAVADSRVLLIGGPPVGERLIEWNFVASTRERLDRARDAWQCQELPKIPGDSIEYIPYPDPHR